MAEEIDDFDRLVAVRDAIALMRDKGRNFNKLKEMKLVAVQNEDYEVAKRIKQELDQERV